jgi:hypothetical protein
VNFVEFANQNYGYNLLQIIVSQYVLDRYWRIIWNLCIYNASYLLFMVGFTVKNLNIAIRYEESNKSMINQPNDILKFVCISPNLLIFLQIKNFDNSNSIEVFIFIWIFSSCIIAHDDVWSHQLFLEDWRHKIYWMIDVGSDRAKPLSNYRLHIINRKSNMR